MGVSPENNALRALERELAAYEKQIPGTPRPPRRRRKRILFSLLVMLGIASSVLALAWPNMSVNALWRGWVLTDQDPGEIAQLKASIDEVSGLQREMAVSIAVLKVEQNEMRAMMQKQPEYYWYSYSPALQFRNPFPSRTPATSPR
jgi:hypothetical protein